jgi:hypothetical protein
MKTKYKTEFTNNLTLKSEKKKKEEEEDRVVGG